MTIKIKITKDVYEKSKSCTSEKTGNNCAVALAIRDIFPLAWVCTDEIWPFCGNCENTTHAIPLPLVATEMIRDFDELAYAPWKRLLLPEFSFNIEVPDEVVAMLNIDDLMRSETLEVVG